MKEIGGYFEMERFRGKLLHENAIALNSGRNCLAYLIQAKKIQKLAVPFFMCDCVFDVCQKYGVELDYYHIKDDFTPDKELQDSNSWIYIMNYYGQLTSRQLSSFQEKYTHIIVDNTQAYFDKPIVGIDTIYTCRKFFGVSDGAFLYTDKLMEKELPQDESYTRMEYLLGRYERTASEFFEKSIENNNFFDDAPIMMMSKLTKNLLRAVDYEWIKSVRTENYNYLHQQLKEINLLNIHSIEGAFAYPLMIEKGSIVRKNLIKEKIYIPTLWPNVLENTTTDMLEHKMADNILPIPCDQRYTNEDMKKICLLIQKYIIKNEV